MKEWWYGLQASERRTLLTGSVLLSLILIYFGGWEPLQNDIDLLKKDVVEQQAIKNWMQQSATEVGQLRGNTAQTQRNGRSLLAIVDQSAKRARLGPSIKRLEPAGNDTVKVYLEQAAFDDMIAWLQDLEQKQGLTISTITIDRQDSPGRVDSRMTLQSIL